MGTAPRAVPLRNLSPDESRLLLTERRVPDADHAAVLAFTHGHPLALVLVADVVRSGGSGAAFSPERMPNVVRALLERFIAAAPSAAHRRALELTAHVRVATEALVGAIVDGADPHELFEWLRGLSFIEQGPEGLFPHDVAREALDADFRWRDPDAYSDMHRRVWVYLKDRLRNATGRAQQRAFFDKLYLHRANPIGGRYHDYGTLGSVYAESATGAITRRSSPPCAGTKVTRRRASRRTGCETSRRASTCFGPPAAGCSGWWPPLPCTIHRPRTWPPIRRSRPRGNSHAAAVLFVLVSDAASPFSPRL